MSKSKPKFKEHRVVKIKLKALPNKTRGTIISVVKHKNIYSYVIEVIDTNKSVLFGCTEQELTEFGN